MSDSYDYSSYEPAASTKQYPIAHSTSSAFSASANPNEDWTKISDLAERRRIQNRIAQRNYRKKLKKRLEDLERRAGSSSASPEQKHRELAPNDEIPERAASPEPSRRRSAASSSRRERTPEMVTQQYILPADDRAMFSQQYTRQLSTSPPPFSYASNMPMDGYASYYPPTNSYCAPASNLELPSYMQQMAPQGSRSCPPAAAPSIKQEYYGDDEMSPFSMSYASMANGEVSTAAAPSAHAYQHNMSAYVSNRPHHQQHQYPTGRVPPAMPPYYPYQEHR